MTLTIAREGPLATIVLDRPAAMNALSLEMRAAIGHAFAELGADDGVRAIILTGAGERAFCAGLDLKELGRDSAALLEGSDACNPVAAVEKCGKPVIGAINGVAVTGGLELALACDILIASPDARFADTHARVGVLPGWGLSQKLSRAIGIYRARHMAFTGQYIDAATAQAWGLVSEVVPHGTLMERARMIGGEIAAIDPAMVRRYKALINEGYLASLGSALATEHDVSGEYNRALPPAQIVGRRAAVMESGRRQS